jgi:hypothetical protein
MVSINIVWEDTVAFCRRESALLVPLALATSLVGDVVNSLVTPVAGAQPNPLLSLVTFAAVVWTIIGQMATMALVLRPGSSVGEALALAARRLPTLIGAALLVGIAVTIVLIPAIIGFMQSGVDLNKQESYALLPAWISLYGLVFAGFAIWLSLRLSVLNPFVVDSQQGIIASLKAAFAMTRGVVSRLILVAFLYFLTTLVLTSVVKFVLGTAFELLGRGIGSPFVAVVLTALATGTVSAALSTIAAVFLAMLYRRISTGT